LARRVCFGIVAYIKKVRAEGRRMRPIVVATVHDDIQQWLDADWFLQTKTGQVTVPPEGGWPHCHGDGAGRIPGAGRTLHPSLSQANGEDKSRVEQLLRPPVIRLEVRRLEPHQPSKEVFQETFEEHHYMRGKLPGCFFGVMVREQESGMPVAFHAIANFPGAGNGGITFLESRLVTLPQWQGFAIGPKLSESIGERLLEAGKRLFSVTHHPRLGGQRQASALWRPTSGNGKARKSLNDKNTGRTAYRHQFVGRDGHGNDEIARKASAKSVGLLKRPGVLVRMPGKTPNEKTSEQMRAMEGKTPREVLIEAGKDKAVGVRKEIERYLSAGYMALQEPPSSVLPAKRLRLRCKTKPAKLRLRCKTTVCYGYPGQLPEGTSNKKVAKKLRSDGRRQVVSSSSRKELPAKKSKAVGKAKTSSTRPGRPCASRGLSAERSPSKGETKVASESSGQLQERSRSRQSATGPWCDGESAAESMPAAAASMDGSSSPRSGLSTPEKRPRPCYEESTTKLLKTVGTIMKWD